MKNQEERTEAKAFEAQFRYWNKQLKQDYGYNVFDSVEKMVM